jgi:hypothetical protein
LQEPYDHAKFQMAIANGGIYACGGNLAWVNPFRSPTPGVPINVSAVRDLQKYYFATPTQHFPQVIRVAVDMAQGKTPGKLGARGWLTSVSPEEIIHALWLAMAAHVADRGSMRIWKACCLTCPMELVDATDANENTQLWLAAVAARERLGADFQAMYRTGPQRAFEIVSFRNRRQATTGIVLGAQALFDEYNASVQRAKGSEFSASFVDTALTCYDRVLSNDTCRMLVLTAQEEFGQQSPYNSLYKLESYTKKAGRHDMNMLIWLLEATNDMTRNDQINPAELTVNNLTGKSKGGKGFLDLLMYKRHVRDAMLGSKLDEALTDSAAKAAIRKAFATHASYRSHFGGKVHGCTHAKDLSWLGIFKGSAHMFCRIMEDLVYQGTYDHIMRQSMKVNKSVSETLEVDSLVEQMDEVRALAISEGGVAPGVPAPVAALAEAAVEATAEFHVACGMKTNTGEVDELKKEMLAKLNPEDKEKLRMFQEEADKLVSTYVKLIVMPKTDSELVQLLKEAPASSITGDATSYCLFIYDPKLAGEAASAPKHRVCSIRTQHLKSVVRSALEARGNADGIQDGDAFLFFDGGRHGNESALLGSLVNSSGKRIEKTHATLFLTYSEESMEESRTQTRGFMSLRQVEQLHVATNSPPQIRKKKNAVYAGTTVGDVIGPIKCVASEHVLYMTFRQKKDVYSKDARVLPSGPSGLSPDDPDNHVRRGDNDIEPLSFHSRVPELYKELLHRFDTKCVWDLTSLDGILPLACILESKPYVGVVQTEAHKKVLLPFLSQAVFSAFQTEGGPLYRPDVANLMAGTDVGEDDSKPSKKKAAAKPKPKGKPSKKKAPKRNKALNAALADEGEEEEGPNDDVEEAEDSDLEEL